jgi:hypothetical protein
VKTESQTFLENSEVEIFGASRQKNPFVFQNIVEANNTFLVRALMSMSIQLNSDGIMILLSTPLSDSSPKFPAIAVWMDSQTRKRWPRNTRNDRRSHHWTREEAPSLHIFNIIGPLKALYNKEPLLWSSGETFDHSVCF